MARLRNDTGNGYDDAQNLPNGPFGSGNGGIPPIDRTGGGSDDPTDNGVLPDDQTGIHADQRTGTGPREDANIRLRGGGGGNDSVFDPTAEHDNTIATPTRPRSPQSMAGSVDPGPQLQPFSPMGSPSVGSMATPQGGGLFGSMGGLQGGGLGLPNNPINGSSSDPISDLLKKIMGGGGGQF